ncbi:MAG: GntR family transcriptional regulator [Tissierellia bacterium]|nr:GntR family transcriptional regulator [Tissierellia bacterium]
MNIIISNSADKPIYMQITEQIKEMIMTEKLLPGDSLPSMRSLAKDLRISVITTKRAYNDLEKEGFIKTVVGVGTFVADKNIEIIKENQYQQIEDYFQKGIKLAKLSDISLEELHEILDIIYRGE